MAQVTLQGNTIHTVGELPPIGALAPPFTLVAGDLSPLSLGDYRGKKVVLNIFPSLDTPTCAASVRRFNKEASERENVTVLCISADLPFAAGRFCAAEGLEEVSSGSTFRAPEFGIDYGVTFADGPLEGLLSRAVVVVDEEGKVVYTEQVAETADEPDYEKALAVL